MVNTAGFSNQGFSFSFGFRRPDKNLFPVNPYTGAPPFGISAPRHAFHPRGVVRFSTEIHGVLEARGFPEILNPVVTRVPIFVVQMAAREISKSKRPRNPMSQMVMTLYSEDQIPIRPPRPRLPRFSSLKPRSLPSEGSGRRFIVQFISEDLKRRIHSKKKGQQREVRNRYWPYRNCFRNLWHESHFVPPQFSLN